MKSTRRNTIIDSDFPSRLFIITSLASSRCSIYQLYGIFILRMHRRTFKIAVTIMFRTKNDTTIKQHGRFYLRSMTLLIAFSHSTRDDPEHEKAPILRLTLKTSWNFFSIFNSFFIEKSFSISTFEFFGSEKRPASDLKTRSMPCGLTFQKRGNSFNIFIETFEWCQLSDPSSGKVQRNQL